MQSNSSMRTGALAILGTGFLWSTGGLFIKLIDWHPFAIAGCRSLIACAFLFVWIRRPKFTWSRNQILAGVANALTMLLFIAANKMTTAANAIILQYISPVITVFLAALFLKEKPRVEHLVALVLVVVGLLVLFMDKLGGGTLAGNVVALLSGLAFSFYFIFMRLQKSESPIESNLLSHAITAVTALTISLFLPFPAVTAQSIIAILLLGLVQIGLSAVLFAYGIQRVSATSASLLAVVEPVFNPVWVLVVLGEAPSPNAIVGGVMVLISVIVVAVASSQRSTGQAQQEAR